MRLLHMYIYTYVCDDGNAPFVLRLVDSKAVSGFAFVLNSAVLHFCSHSRMALSLALSLSLSIPLRTDAARESLAAPELDVELRRLSAYAAQISLWRTAKRFGWQPRSAFTQWATSG